MGVAISGMKFEAPNVLILCMDNNEGTVRISRLLWDQRPPAVTCRCLLPRSTAECETVPAVHAGEKALSSEASCEIAEHATDDALTPAENSALRLIVAGNANKQIADH
jgi:DNA-binding NarL/FixJ family response regulator